MPRSLTTLTLIKSTVLVGVVALSACASKPPYEWVKDGGSSFERNNHLNECLYQIRLSRTPNSEQDELMKLCMHGKGYRQRVLHQDN